MAETKSKKKIIIISVVAVILVAAIISGIIFLPDLLNKEEKKTEEVSAEIDFSEVIRKHTDMPVVEIVSDDFDDDGQKEAFAVVGEIEYEINGHRKFNNADIYFINCKQKVQLIRSDVSGIINGIIKEDKTNYLSIEIYSPLDQSGKSYLYTAKGEKPAENKFSGIYTRLVMLNDAVFAHDEYGMEMEIEESINSYENVVLEPPVIVTPSGDHAVPPDFNDAKIITPTEKDFKNFPYTNGLFFGYIGMKNYNYTAENALETAYSMTACDEGFLYGCYFNASDVVYLQEDPLGKWSYCIRYPADNFDWMLHHVLNVKPDRNNPPIGYYHEGYFYETAPGGFGSGLWNESFDYEIIEGNKVKVTVTTSFEYAEEGMEPYFYSTYIAALKEVDGKRVWSVYDFDVGDIASVRGW